MILFEVKYILLAFITVLVIKGLINVFKRRELFNPTLLFSFPILISIIINLIYYDTKYAISDETYFLYLFSIIAFMVGILLGSYFNIRVNTSNNIIIKKTAIKIVWLCMIFCSFFALVQIYRGYTSGIYGTGLKYFFGNVRYYTGYVNENNFFAKYGIVLADFLVLYYLYLFFVRKEKNKKILFLLMSSVIFYLIFTATEFNKTNLLYLFCIAAFFFITGNLNNMKKIIFFTLVGLVLLIILLNFISVNTGKGIIDGENWFYFYFGSEFRWLDLFAFQEKCHTNGFMSLGIVGRFLSFVGIIPSDGYDAYRAIAMEYHSPVSSFVLGPYLDFGYFGLIVLILYGIFIGLIYKYHKKIGGLWTIFYATCIYQLVISFFAFQFGMSSQIYVLILFIVLSHIKTEKVSVSIKNGVAI